MSRDILLVDEKTTDSASVTDPTPVHQHSCQLTHVQTRQYTSLAMRQPIAAMNGTKYHNGVGVVGKAMFWASVFLLSVAEVCLVDGLQLVRHAPLVLGNETLVMIE